MSPEARPPLRVEQALRLLPDIDALAPLRAFLISTSRAQKSLEPYDTVGKRLVHPADVKGLLPHAISRVSDHLVAVYGAAVEALEAEERGDLSEVVRALLRAGALERTVGRSTQARVWYDRAVLIAEELRDRRPEIEALRHVADLQAEQGTFEDAARTYQRSLALADVEQDAEGAALACRGLGEAALAQSKWQGASSWFTRGTRYAERETRLTGLLLLGLSHAAMSRDRLEEAADWISQARGIFQQLDDASGMVQTLNASGLLRALQSSRQEALSDFREALARLGVEGGHARLEMGIRLNIAELYLDWGRLPDAEDELRRAEESCIVHNLQRQLARLYVVMGKVRGRQGDDTGFVFFEKAIELCREVEALPRLEAEVYLEYGLFKKEFGEDDESRAYLERAREILEPSRDDPLGARIDGELEALQPR